MIKIRRLLIFLSIFVLFITNILSFNIALAEDNNDEDIVIVDKTSEIVEEKDNGIENEGVDDISAEDDETTGDVENTTLVDKDDLEIIDDLEDIDVDSIDNYSVSIDDEFFYRIFHIDNGRKYFSVEDLAEIMDVLSDNDYSHIELAIGNDGLRFLLDDMSLSVNGVNYSHEQVYQAMHQGNLDYYDCGDRNELSQSDMDFLLAYAGSRNLSIIPLLNTPGHMSTLLSAMQYLGIEDVAFENSSTTIDLNNSVALEFTKKIVEKYVEYFADKGVEIFNLGMDEYALDIQSGFSDLINRGLYDNFIDYANDLARIVKSYGIVPMVFNDGVYFNSNFNYGSFDTDILIAYWSNQNGYCPARSLIDKGHKLINTNANWYYVLGNPYTFFNYFTALEAVENINCRRVMGYPDAPVSGSMLCFWSDIPGNSYLHEAKEWLFDLITTFAHKNQDVFNIEENIVVDNDNSFMANWLFNYGDIENGENYNLDDSGWERVKVPHDYSSYLNYSNYGEAESGYLLGGVGWYRKHFYIDKEDADKIIQIHFSGVYMNATVYINGHRLGNHPYGYTPFSFDLTDYINYGKDNILCVRVDHQQGSSRWYSGSGIIRDVKLSIQNKTYIPENGVAIDTSDIDITHVKTTINSDDNKNVILVQSLYDSNYNLINTEYEVFDLITGTNVISQNLESNNIQLWSIDNPNLYELRTDIICNGKVIDSKWNEIGYRTYSMDPDNGFYLNGENIKLKGACLHSDYGALGTAVNESALKRQLTTMKRMGVNAIRVTHNPGNDQLFTLCNRMGILVIEEAFDGWSIAKNYNYEDYSKYFNQTISSDNKILNRKNNMTWAEFDIKQMVLNSMNNPCVIMYSLGNELFVDLVSEDNIYSYIAEANNLIRWIREIDDDHLITVCDDYENNKIDGRNIFNQICENIVSNKGAVGLNYCNPGTYDAYHTDHPDRAIYASEVDSTLSSREFYESKTVDQNRKEVSSYGGVIPEWGRTAWAAWEDVISRDFVAGEFIWAGIDYTGEPTPWNKTSSSWGQGDNYPKSSYFGAVDTAGFEKDLYYFYQSQWNEKINTLHILPNWNLDKVVRNSEGKIDVLVFTDAASVELFLNDVSLGIKSYNRYQTPNGFTYQKHDGNMYMTWSVDAVEGTLKAIAYDEDGNVITDTDGRNKVTTSGQAYSIKLDVYEDSLEADGRSLFFISAIAQDEDGNYVPDADNLVEFIVEGNARVIASDAGNPADTVNMKSNTRKLYHGKALAIVQVTSETGKINVKARASGLISDEISLTVTEKTDVRKPENNNYPKNITEDMFIFGTSFNGTQSIPSVISKLKDMTADDYDLTIKQIDLENFSVEITGKNNFKSTIKKELNITDISKLEIDPGKLTLDIGDEYLLKTIIKSEDISAESLLWSSSDETVVKVDKKGRINALAAGLAIVSVYTEDGNNTAVCEVEVIDPSLDDAAYAVLKDNGDLIFFRSNDHYNNDTVGIFTDIYNNSYQGRVFSHVENNNENKWNNYKENIRKVYVAENQTIRPASFNRWFNNCVNLEQFISTGFDTSLVKDMSYMFKGCSSLIELDLRSFNTGSVINMTDMFSGCASLERIILGPEFTRWSDNASLPDGTWNNGPLWFSSLELLRQYPINSNRWSGTWIRSNNSNGEVENEDLPYIREGLWMSELSDEVYTGKAITKKFNVYDGKKKLFEGTDYTVRYKDNTKVGMATVTVTGKGNYQGTLSKTFNINKADINAADIDISLNRTYFKYNGKAQTPSIIITRDNGVRLNNKDYSIEYYNETGLYVPAKQIVAQGVYQIYIVGKGNYTGEREMYFYIQDKTPIENLNITLSANKFTYDGTNKTPVVTIRDGNNVVYKTGEIDYGYFNLIYSDNRNAGTAKITVTPGNGNYVGKAIRTYTIGAVLFNAKRIEVNNFEVSRNYTGKEIRQDSLVLYDNVEGVNISDYDITYKNNINAGTATVTFTGKGNYSGSFSKTFKILKQKINSDDVVIDETYVYTKGGVKVLPEVIVDGKVLVNGIDYTLSYRNNNIINDNSNPKKLTSLIVKGKGNYDGSAEKHFKITTSNQSYITMSAKDRLYSNKAGTMSTNIILMDSNGGKLFANTDYDRNIRYTYALDTVLADGINRSAGDEVLKTDLIEIDTMIKATVTLKGNYEGSISDVFRIIAKDISKASVTVKDQYYLSGLPVSLSKDDIIIKLGKDILSENDYEIVSYSNNINKGTGTVTLRGVGEYGGIRIVSYRIAQRSMGVVVKFNSSGATSGNMNNQLIYDNKDLNKCTYKKTGKVFMGWSTVKGGTVVDFKDRDNQIYERYRPGDVVVLYAVWK